MREAGESYPMTLEDLRSRRDQLEREIRGDIAARVRRFAEDTGSWPTDISIRLVEVATVGEPEGRRVVESVEVELGRI